MQITERTAIHTVARLKTFCLTIYHNEKSIILNFFFSFRLTIRIKSKMFFFLNILFFSNIFFKITFTEIILKEALLLRHRIKIVP